MPAAARQKAKRSYQCSECDLKFPSPYALRIHKQGHNALVDPGHSSLAPPVPETAPAKELSPESWEAMRLIAESLGKLEASERMRVMRAVNLLLG